MIVWLKLLRLPNVFTAVADVMMGYVVTHGDLRPVEQFSLLVSASCLLYLSGMALNDVFDVKVDARDRPDRPIPSGRVSLRAAISVGCALLVSGVLVAWFASFNAGNWRPGAIATALAVCIVLYDAVLKRTPLAPLMMGACRTLNVLLGMSLAPLADDFDLLNPGEATSLYIRWETPAPWVIACAIGVYVVGVTIFARTEARASSRARLVGGMSVMLLGMALAVSTPLWTGNDPPLVVGRNGWYLLWAVLALITMRRCALAALSPSPANVQAAVRHCVQSIIVLDAAVCVGYAGPFWALAVLALIFPTLLLAFWLKAT